MMSWSSKVGTSPLCWDLLTWVGLGSWDPRERILSTLLIWHRVLSSYRWLFHKFYCVVILQCSASTQISHRKYALVWKKKKKKKIILWCIFEGQFTLGLQFDEFGVHNTPYSGIVHWGSTTKYAPKTSITIEVNCIVLASNTCWVG